MTWKIPLFKIGWTPDDVAAVKNVIERGTFWASGPEIEALEIALAEYHGQKHCLVFNSGTSALHAALLAHDVKGKEVIVPSFTFISGVNTVVLAGGIPVFAESESETFGLDTNDVEKKITKNTKAIVPIHYGGAVSRDIAKLRQLCDKHDLILIEDAAESIGSTLNGKKAGTYGHSAMFSFCQNKIITSGEGGAIVTDDDAIYHKMKMIRSHGRLELEEDYFSSVKDNDYLELGYNDRMSSMTAALCHSQLKRVDKIIEERQTIARKISERLSNVKEISLPLLPPEYRHVYQMYTILLKDKKTRDGLQQHLEKQSIMTKVYFNCVHLKTYYRKAFGHEEGDLPFTEQLSDRVLTLPFYPGMTDEEIHSLCEHIASFFQSFKKSPTFRDNK
jgi:perosamine synthetase